MITSLEQVMESRLTWPENKPRAAHRARSPFKGREASASARRIEDEMPRWGVKSFIISRNNQRIYAGDPGVALWWLDRKKQLRVLACDKWDKLADNLHAIYLTLDAMRALERWGAYTAEQASEGARPALPPPASPQADPWWLVLGWGAQPNYPAADMLVLANTRYRSMAKDVAGDQLVRLNAAIESARKELGAP